MNLRARLFLSYVILTLVFMVVISVSVMLLMRSYIDNQSLSGLNNMTAHLGSDHLPDQRKFYRCPAFIHHSGTGR